MRQTQWLVGLVALTWSLAHYGAAQRPDPLNAKEVDEMREAADYPDKRLELMTGFARARMASIEQSRADPKNAKDRPAQIHDLLRDFTSLLDEIDDNIDVYASHKTDMRKGLKLVIEADSEWHLQLRKLKDQSPPEELDQYSFVLTNAAEAVEDTGDSARKELQTQNELAKEKKLNKVYSERTD
jgi:hypothetical protein